MATAVESAAARAPATYGRARPEERSSDVSSPSMSRHSESSPMFTKAAHTGDDSESHSRNTSYAAADSDSELDGSPLKSKASLLSTTQVGSQEADKAAIRASREASAPLSASQDSQHVTGKTLAEDDDAFLERFRQQRGLQAPGHYAGHSSQPTTSDLTSLPASSSYNTREDGRRETQTRSSDDSPASRIRPARGGLASRMRARNGAKSSAPVFRASDGSSGEDVEDSDAESIERSPSPAKRLRSTVSPAASPFPSVMRSTEKEVAEQRKQKLASMAAAVRAKRGDDAALNEDTQDVESDLGFDSADSDVNDEDDALDGLLNALDRKDKGQRQKSTSRRADAGRSKGKSASKRSTERDKDRPKPLTKQQIEETNRMAAQIERNKRLKAVKSNAQPERKTYNVLDLLKSIGGSKAIAPPTSRATSPTRTTDSEVASRNENPAHTIGSASALAKHAAGPSLVARVSPVLTMRSVDGDGASRQQCEHAARLRAIKEKAMRASTLQLDSASKTTGSLSLRQAKDEPDFEILGPKSQIASELHRKSSHTTRAGAAHLSANNSSGSPPRRPELKDSERRPLVTFADDASSDAEFSDDCITDAQLRAAGKNLGPPSAIAQGQPVRPSPALRERASRSAAVQGPPVDIEEPEAPSAAQTRSKKVTGPLAVTREQLNATMLKHVALQNISHRHKLQSHSAKRHQSDAPMKEHASTGQDAQDDAARVQRMMDAYALRAQRRGAEAQAESPDSDEDESDAEYVEDQVADEGEGNGNDNLDEDDVLALGSGSEDETWRATGSREESGSDAESGANSDSDKENTQPSESQSHSVETHAHKDVDTEEDDDNEDEVSRIPGRHRRPRTTRHQLSDDEEDATRSGSLVRTPLKDLSFTNGLSPLTGCPSPADDSESPASAPDKQTGLSQFFQPTAALLSNVTASKEASSTGDVVGAPEVSNGGGLSQFFKETQAPGADLQEGTSSPFASKEFTGVAQALQAQKESKIPSDNSVLGQFFTPTQNDAPLRGESLDIFARTGRVSSTANVPASDSLSQWFTSSQEDSQRPPRKMKGADAEIMPPPATAGVDAFAALRRAQANADYEPSPSFLPSLGSPGEDSEIRQMEREVERSRAMPESPAQEAPKQYINSRGYFTQTKPGTMDSQTQTQSQSQSQSTSPAFNYTADLTPFKPSRTISESPALRGSPEQSLQPQRRKRFRIAAADSQEEENQDSTLGPHDDGAEEARHNRAEQSTTKGRQNDAGSVEERAGTDGELSIRAAPAATRDAFALMRDAQKLPERPKMRSSNFVEGEAEESEEEDVGGKRGRGGGGLGGIFDEDDSESDGENEDEDDDGQDLVELVNNENEVDEAEKDILARERYQEDVQVDEAAAMALAEKAARGDLRRKRRRGEAGGLEDLLDEDWDEEYLQRKAANPRAFIAKKRRLEGEDEMDFLAQREESQAFVKGYSDTHGADEDAEKYAFLGGADSDEGGEAESSTRAGRPSIHQEMSDREADSDDEAPSSKVSYFEIARGLREARKRKKAGLIDDEEDDELQAKRRAEDEHKKEMERRLRSIYGDASDDEMDMARSALRVRDRVAARKEAARSGRPRAGNDAGQRHMAFGSRAVDAESQEALDEESQIDRAVALLMGNGRSKTEAEKARQARIAKDLREESSWGATRNSNSVRRGGSGAEGRASVTSFGTRSTGNNKMGLQRNDSTSSIAIAGERKPMQSSSSSSRLAGLHSVMSRNVNESQ
ncbi:hypothetical protein IE81DRAFT_321150 [Ceraceosorus guamensis]|uniref:DNA replication checkpoint mediator MRC1 domain-containing protein n=1 Tax=Ceraceosorus guamensis TaxID=1522189 RepID=A0A316W4A9_9BASI|nr:hypothetical protein IE81DRAFT_321150 [Ceraceosorus guamensis]PWN44532.1 hypothetical protein IE81DRAFT_321150 [Ceraceosorus guamensis]